MLVVLVRDRVVVERPARFLGVRRLPKAAERAHRRGEYTPRVPDLVLDAARSRVRIHTFAEGLLARLAHDLELSCGELEGTASGDKDATAGTASILVPLRGMAVAGVLGKDGRVDDRGLSPTERRDCIAKMYSDVFHSRAGGVVRVEVKLAGGEARLRIVPPSESEVVVVIRPDLRPEAGGVRATGSFDVSLKAIGSGPVKGPMGAFRVKDRVMISFDVLFVVAPPAPPSAQPA